VDQGKVESMPTDLGKPYTIDWRGNPPHMLKPDIPVWWRFMEKWGFQYKTIYYDCLLGGPAYTEEQLKDPMMRMWRQNLSKRADAIGETESEVHIIEVASDPRLRALGQLQVYRALWLQDPKIMKPEKLVLVCDRLDPDLASACATYGIMAYVMPP